MPRVLMVADSLGGGLGAALATGTTYLAGRGWDVEVLAPGPGRTGGQSLAASHHPVDLPRSARSLAAMRAAATVIRRHIDRARPDVVHAHGMRSFVATRFLARRPTAVTLHGSGAAADDPWGYHRLRRAGLALLPHAAEAAFSAVPDFPAPWVFAVHASPELARLARLPAPSPVAPFLWLGRLDDPKQPQLFVDAVVAVATAGSVEVSGVVAGEGPFEAALRAQIERRAAPVRLLGHRRDLPVLLGGCRAVVLLSRFEAVPFAVTEAMWAGRAVIASDLPGTRWLTGGARRAHGVSLVRDVAETATAMTRLADPGVAAADGSLAAERVRQLLTPVSPWPQVERAYAGLRAP